MKKKIWLIIDLLLIVISLLVAIAFYNIHPSQGLLRHMAASIPMLVVLTLVALWKSGLYKAVLRYASLDLAIQVLISTLAGTGITYIISLIVYLIGRKSDVNIFLMPRPVYLMQWLLSTLLIIGSRLVVRWKGSMENRSGKEKKSILIIGAGYSGATVVRDIQNGRYGDATAVAILDTDESKAGTQINRVPVLDLDIQPAVEQYLPDEIIITVSSPSQSLLDACVATGKKIRIFSEAQGLVRELNIADLLGRPETHLDMGEAKAYFSGKRVLVTGGGGSIGSELCRQILAFTPAQLIIYDISENYMYDLLFELRERYGDLVNNTVRLEVGSVRDEESLWRVMGRYRPEVCIHAAAHKHVPLMEDSPEQAILNNVLGTEKTVRVAESCGCQRFVLISTDKAVNPTNVMGASKRLAEMVVSSHNGRMETVAVRFGNVLGSHGSVVPIFERQIKAGGPVTLTDENIIRYFMTIPEAASLVLQAASMAHGGELYVLDMGEPVRIKDLAERMIRLYGSPDVRIDYVGLRPGEKLYEELLLDKENDVATERDRIYIAKQEKVDRAEVEAVLKTLETALEHHSDIKTALKTVVPTYHGQ